MVSIHAPTSGATSSERIFPCLSMFQSTLPRGERHYYSKLFIIDADVSIHAPTRGATAFVFFPFNNSMFQSTLPRGERQFEQLNMPEFIGGFNPRSHEGSDLRLSFKNGSMARFQSTLPRGERLLTMRKITLILAFQSTLPRGERLIGDE